MKPFPLFLAMTLAASTAAFADGVDRTRAPEAGPLPEVKIPTPVTETLANGLRVFILPDHRQPTVTFRLLIKSGAYFDGAKPGLADLTAELLNKGTSTLSADEFASQTDFLGARVEADAADDSLDLTASGLSRDAGALLGFLKGAALDPAFRAEEVEKEKTRTLADLAQKRANPSDLAARLRDQLLYGKHPYGASPTPESVRSLTREDLAAFHSAHFLPNNATLAIVGDVEPKEVLKLVQAAFGDWKKGEAPKEEAASFPQIEKASFHLVDRPASVQSNVLVVGKGFPRNNPDLPEASVVNSVLGGGFSGRLFANLREKNGYTYGAYSHFLPKKEGGSFFASAQVRNEVTAAAITEMMKEITRITSEPVPTTELNLQKTYLAGNYLLSFENNARVAQRLQEADLFGLPDGYYETYAKRLMAVTPDVAEKLAQKYLAPGEMLTIVVGKAEEVRPQLEKLGKVTVYDEDLNVKK